MPKIDWHHLTYDDNEPVLLGDVVRVAGHPDDELYHVTSIGDTPIGTIVSLFSRRTGKTYATGDARKLIRADDQTAHEYWELPDKDICDAAFQTARDLDARIVEVCFYKPGDDDQDARPNIVYRFMKHGTYTDDIAPWALPESADGKQRVSICIDTMYNHYTIRFDTFARKLAKTGPDSFWIVPPDGPDSAWQATDLDRACAELQDIKDKYDIGSHEMTPAIRNLCDIYEHSDVDANRPDARASSLAYWRAYIDAVVASI